ncbi:MAG: hypothetical protein Roseis2KO_36270 [Roseivirga sp.]
MRIPHYWLYIFLLATAGLFFFYQQNQPALSYDFAPQFDGNDYRAIHDYFVGNIAEYEVSFPFHSRILVPWLAAQLNTGNIIHDFQWINLAFSLLSVFMLFQLWRMLGLELRWFFIGFGWLLLHWTGMIRLNAFDPITVDVPLFFFQALFIWLIFKRKFAWLLLLGPVATLQKESFVALLLILTAYGWYHNKREDDAYFDLKWIIGALALSILAKAAVNQYFSPVEAGRGAVITLLYHAKEAILHPFELVRWLVAAFVAFGPLLMAGVFKAVKRPYYDNRRNLLILFSGLYLAFGILAGGDMTRIIYLGFPFIATWLMYEFRELQGKTLWLLVCLSLPLTFLIKTIPDPAFEWDRWQNWYPEFASMQTVGYFGIYFLISLGVVLANRQKLV